MPLVTGSTVGPNPALLNSKNTPNDSNGSFKLKLEAGDNAQIIKTRKDNFQGLVNYLHVALNYSANKNSYFTIDPDGLTSALQSINITFGKDDAEQLISICTHKNISLFHSVSYAPGAAELFKHINCKVDSSILNNLKTELQSITKWSLKTKEWVIRCSKGHLFSTYNSMNSSNTVDLRGVDLRGADLRGADFCRVDLRVANLEGANLQGAYLKEVDLQGANLKAANMGQANLEQAKLQGTILEDANLKKAILWYAYLNGANLKEADLEETDLSNATLDEVNLDGVKNLKTANLYSSSLRKVDLRDINLQGVKLQTIQLQEVNLQNMDLRGLNLHYVYLEGANLQGANLEDANLRNARLMRANLEGAKLKGANLEEAGLQGANLREQNLEKLNLKGAFFCGANLEGATLILDLADLENTGRSVTGIKQMFDKPTVDEKTKITLKFSDNLDLVFNHLNNDESGSILTFIDDIDDQYKNLKINLMQQVITHLNQQADISSIIESLKDILLNSGFNYLEDQSIQKFVVDKLLIDTIKKGNVGEVRICDKEIDLLFSYVNNLDELEQKKFMLENNGFFIQLIHLGRIAQKEETKELALKLYDSYLKIEYVKNINAQLIEMSLDDDSLILVDEKCSEACSVTDKYIEQFLRRKPIPENSTSSDAVNWGSVNWFMGTEFQYPAKLNLPTLFNKFKIFKANYDFEQNKIKVIRLFTILNLDKYNKEFTEALSKKSVEVKFVENPYQGELATIFNQYLSPDEACKLFPHKAEPISLKNEHLKDIFTEFETADYSIKDKAQLLLLLSGIFTTFSSKPFFGKEGESPIALRYYAYALMKAAYALDKEIMEIEVYKDCVNRFLKLNGVHECSEMLSKTIIKLYKGFENKKLDGILPPAWQ